MIQLDIQYNMENVTLLQECYYRAFTNYWRFRVLIGCYICGPERWLFQIGILYWVSLGSTGALGMGRGSTSSCHIVLNMTVCDIAQMY